MSLISSKLLTSLPSIEHGFGTRQGPASQDGMARLTQIHSSAVIVTESAGCGGEGDALITKKPGLAVSIRTADCLPILLADPITGVVAAVHAGWRGTAAGIAGEAIRRMHLEFSTEPGNLRAAIGPGIGECCYKVGAEVAERFRRFFPERDDLTQESYINLAEANRRQLIECGVRDDRIEEIQVCTFCDSANYYSYRREGHRAGRMISYIRLVPSRRL